MIATTEGDAGDLVYCLAVLRAAGGGPHSLLIEEKSDYTAQRNREISETLLRFCGSLAESQPYIKECRLKTPDDQVQWKSGDFRRMGMHSMTHTLLRTHLNHLNRATEAGVAVDESEAWLSVEPSPESGGMVTINRTARYNNPWFPWELIVKHYGERILFLGLPHEHRTFCEKFGFVRHRPTQDLLEMARLIAGSDLFIGNQSCANACNEGMKHAGIQETDLNIPDCVFQRANAQYVGDGHCLLPDVSGSGAMETPKRKFEPNYLVQTNTQPRTGWICMGITEVTYGTLSRKLMREKGMSDGAAHKAILDELYKREPGYFSPNHEEMALNRFKEAMARAS